MLVLENEFGGSYGVAAYGALAIYLISGIDHF